MPFFSRFFNNDFFLVVRNLRVLHRISPYEFICNCSLLFDIIYLYFEVVRLAYAVRGNTSYDGNGPEMDTDTEKRKWETEPSIRDFGLSTRIRSLIRVIFSVCLSVYFLDIWRFLYLPTISSFIPFMV